MKKSSSKVENRTDLVHGASFTENPGIDLTYGQKTWLPTQSAIDIIQNHLDANTTVHEKQQLRLLGISDYKPNSKEQQKIISLLSGLNSEKKVSAKEKIYKKLKELCPGEFPSLKSLESGLKKLTYTLPTIQYKVSDGKKTIWSSAEKSAQLGLEWQIQGFRIHDAGSGFDHRLLGMMGASTKGESTSKRGGLGEGLKMSITHLVRAGALVRILSKTPDGIWLAEPKVSNQQITFEGKIKPLPRKKAIQGSITEVDFSTEGIGKDLKSNFQAFFDPRLGEGLGKYVLDYRPGADKSYVETSGIITELFPKTRVYVKGLLVQERSDLHFSYNLTDKWAISGRDRKTVKQEVLEKTIENMLEKTRNPLVIKSLLKQVSEGKVTLEIAALLKSPNIAKANQKLWREGLENVFQFKLGKDVFAPADISSNRIRYIASQGFEIIFIPSGCQKVISFIEALYPGEVVSERKLKGEVAAAIEKATSEPAYLKQKDKPKEEPEIKLKGVSEKALEWFTSHRDKFTYMMEIYNAKILLERFARPVDLHNLSTLVPESMPDTLWRSKTVTFDRETRKFLINPKSLLDKAADIELYLELLKYTCYSSSFDSNTQDILSHFAGTQIAGELKVPLFNFDFSYHLTDFVSSLNRTYSSEQRKEDAALIEIKEISSRLMEPGISKEEVEEIVRQIKLKKEGVTTPHSARDWEEVKFQWGDEVYRLKYGSYEFTKIDFDEVIQEQDASLFRSSFLHSKRVDRIFSDSWDDMPLPLFIAPKVNSGFPKANMPATSESKKLNRLLSTDAGRYELEKNQINYLHWPPEKDVCKIKINGEEETVFLKRQGRHILSQVIKGPDIFQEESYRDFFTIYGPSNSFFHVYSSVIQIKSNKGCTLDVSFEVLSTTTVALAESNQGKNFLETSVALDYGKQVWNDPKRIFLDAIQNHIDAEKNIAPSVEFILCDTDGKIIRKTQDEVLRLDKKWSILGVRISDKGAGYSTSYLSILGGTTKNESDIGKFGEGLKMLCASCVRQGIPIELGSRNWKAKPRGFQKEILDYESGGTQRFEMLGYDLEWSAEADSGSYTQFGLIDIGADQKSLNKVQKKELMLKLTSDADFSKTWNAWMELVDPRLTSSGKGLQEVVLNEVSQHTNGIVSLYPDRPGEIFEKRLLVSKQSKPSLFGYNVDATLINTRERNDFDPKLLARHITHYYSDLSDKAIIKKILEAMRDEPETEYFEYAFLNFNKEALRQTYHEVFGDDAVLSLMPIYFDAVQQYNHASQMRTFSFGGPMHAPRFPEELARYVGNESHLENSNLVKLPLTMTRILYSSVYSSENYSKELASSEIEVSPEIREDLLSTVSEINSRLIRALEIIESNPALKVILDGITGPELEKRKASILEIKPEQIKVWHKSCPAMGAFSLDENKKPEVYLNEDILSKKRDLIDTYIHELGHYLTGARDYTPEFNKFLMLLALANDPGWVN
jgi:hypothetical protein